MALFSSKIHVYYLSEITIIIITIFLVDKMGLQGCPQGKFKALHFFVPWKFNFHYLQQRGNLVIKSTLFHPFSSKYSFI